jgi:hypothetical protein
MRLVRANVRAVIPTAWAFDTMGLFYHYCHIRILLRDYPLCKLCSVADFDLGDFAYFTKVVLQAV